MLVLVLVLVQVLVLSLVLVLVLVQVLVLSLVLVLVLVQVLVLSQVLVLVLVLVRSQNGQLCSRCCSDAPTASGTANSVLVPLLGCASANFIRRANCCSVLLSCWLWPLNHSCSGFSNACR